MKKNSIISILGFVALGIISIGLMVFNTSNNVPVQTDNSLTLRNVKATQASAYEITCDLRNNQTCTINISGQIGTSYGNVVRIN